MRVGAKEPPARSAIHYDPDGTTTVTLDGISAGDSCPGEATDPDSLDIRLE